MKIISSSSIEAGLAADIKNMIKGLSKSLAKGFDRLFQAGLNVKDVKKDDKTGVMTYTVTTKENEEEFEVELTPSMNAEGYWDVKIDNNGDIETKNHVPDEDVDKFVEDYVKDMFDDSVGDVVRSSFQIELTRSNVSGNDTVSLSKICCSADPSTALMVVDNILDDSDLMDSIQDTQAFEIVPEGEDICVSDIDECRSQDPFYELMYWGCNLQNIAHAVHWNAKGAQFHDLHMAANDLYSEIDYEIDALAEFTVEYNGYVNPMSYFYKQLNDVETSFGFDYQEGIAMLQSAIQKYLDALTLQYCNVTKDVQVVFDGWIGQLTKMANYFLNRPQI